MLARRASRLRFDEAVVAFEIARAFCEKFGGDSLDEMQRNVRGYLDYLASRRPPASREIALYKPAFLP